MPKELTTVTEDGVEFWTGDFDGFEDAVGIATACGFTTPDMEYSRIKDTAVVLAYARGMQLGFKVVDWTINRANVVYLIVGC